MHAPDDRESYKAFYDAVCLALFELWDPIGVRGCIRTKDEYDAFAPPVCRMLMTGAPKQVIIDYLLSVEIGQLGLRGDRAHTERCVEAVMQRIIGRT